MTQALEFTSGKYNGVSVDQVIKENGKYCKALVNKYEKMMELGKLVDYLKRKEAEIDESIQDQKANADEPVKKADITGEDLELLNDRLDESNANARKFKGKLHKILEIIRAEDE